MATTLVDAIEQDDIAAWRGFAPGSWRSRVNVREFIQRNYTPYEGDSSFLQGATDRTRGIWKTLQPLLAQERERRVDRVVVIEALGVPDRLACDGEHDRLTPTTQFTSAARSVRLWLCSADIHHQTFAQDIAPRAGQLRNA